MELKLSPKGGILLSQESYTSDLMERYPDVKESFVPIGRVEDGEESPPDPSDIRKAQTLVGELSWLSTKTRPDLAYAVSWLGSRASKRPKKVCQAGMQTLGYLKRTLGHGLLYKKCQEADRGPDGKLAFCRDSNTLEVHSDASFGGSFGRVVRSGWREISPGSSCSLGWRCLGDSVAVRGGEID